MVEDSPGAGAHGFRWTYGWNLPLKWHVSRCLEYLRIPNGSFIQCCSMMCYDVWRNLQRQCLITRMTIVCSDFSIKSNFQLIIFVGSESPFVKWKPICMQVSRHALMFSTCSLKLKHQNSGIKTRGLECVLLTLLVEIWSSVVMAPLKLQRPKAQGITRVSAMAKFSSQQLQGAAFCDRCSGSIHFILSWRFLQPLVLVYLGHLLSRCNGQQIDLLMIRSFETSWAFYLISRFWRRALVS